tara:strand:- start:137 stop:346 length:210 start_codon:yes stop_codon:yes gene_type:complete
MSNLNNQSLKEKLYDEAYEEVREDFQSGLEFLIDTSYHHNIAVNLAESRWHEMDHDLSGYSFINKKGVH